MKVTVIEGRKVKEIKGVDNISFSEGKACFRILWGEGYKLECYEFARESVMEIRREKND